MSVYYDIKEHLVIEDTKKHWYELDLISWSLALMGAWLLNNRGKIHSLRAVADGAEYTFSGDKMTEAYHDILNAINQAKTLDITWDYGFSASAPFVNPGPFDMMEHLSDTYEESPDFLEGLFYSAYNHADCGVGAGIVVAYGMKDGVMHSGELPYVSAAGIPDGNWYAREATVVFDLEDATGMDVAKIEEICREMTRFSTDDTLDVRDGGVCFFLNNLSVKTDAELKQFMQLYAQLMVLTNNECGLMGELVDLSGPDARILRFDVNADGTYTLEMAAV